MRPFLVVLVYVSSVSVGADRAEISHSGPNVPSRRSKRASILPYYYDNLLVQSMPPNQELKNWLVDEHNSYRRKVPATDMMMMFWSDKLAESAQRHADRCDFGHSTDRVKTGENIWAAPYQNYSDAVRLWYQEVHDPWCGCQHAYKHCCGHYVQVVWAKSYLLGCGFAHCRDIWGVRGRGHRNVLVCHYNPQGNTIYPRGGGSYYAVPAFNWADQNKPRCSECPSFAPACHEGLCYHTLG